MIVFTPLSKEKRINNKQPGIYRFVIDEIYETKTYRGESAVKMKLFLAELSVSIKFQLGINDTAASHYFLERFLNCIGLVYPEDGKLETENLQNLSGVAKFVINPVYSSLIVDEFLIITPLEPTVKTIPLPYLGHEFDAKNYLSGALHMYSAPTCEK